MASISSVDEYGRLVFGTEKLDESSTTYSSPWMSQCSIVFNLHIYLSAEMKYYLSSIHRTHYKYCIISLGIHAEQY